MRVKRFNGDRQRGFSLIEVLIGVVIAAVGVVGVLQLQKVFIQSSGQANARSIAMQLTREQFDIFKSTDAFAAITSGTDGANPISRSNFSFSRSWIVTPRYYNDDVTPARWQENTTGITPAPAGPDAINVVVSVSWPDIDNNTQQVQQTELLSKISLHDSTTVTSNLNEKGEPKVLYNAGQTPESPPITLVDETMVTGELSGYDTKETSKPIPTVYANNRYKLIQFETVVFDTDTETQTLEDFSTVNCSCSFDGTAQARTPATLLIDNGELINDQHSGQEIDKVTAVTSSSDQPFLCSKCCAGHHDSSGSAAKYVAGSSGNHPHFLDVSASAITSGNYIEACRFRRIDGFYQLVPDWILIKLIIMAQGYFLDADNVTAYTAYVKAVVKAHIKGTALPADLGNRNLTNTVAGSQQLIARGIYVDQASLSATDRATVVAEIDASNEKWLELVPFHEINLTLFADWSSDDPTVGTVTQDDIITIVDVSQNYYGTYSRGRLTALADGNATISATVNLDNTGITGSGAIIPIVDPDTLTTDSIAISVSTSGSGNNSITIEVNCLTLNNQNNIAACHAKDTQEIIVVRNPSNISCSYSPQSGNRTAVANCTGVPQHWNGSISLSKTGYSFEYFKYVAGVAVAIDPITGPFDFSDIVITGTNSNTVLKVVMTEL